MKIATLISLENEMLDNLRTRALDGDSAAAAVYLEHLREVSKNIEAWKKNKDREEKQIAAEKRKTEKTEN